MADDEDRYIEAELEVGEPSEYDLTEYCKYLGIDRAKDPDLVWIAIAGYQEPLPKGWKFFKDKYNPEISFFYNPAQDLSISEHPLDQAYKELYYQEKRKKDAGLPYAKSVSEMERPIVYEAPESPPTRKRKKHRRQKQPEPEPEPEPKSQPRQKPEPEPESEPQSRMGVFELESESAPPLRIESTTTHAQPVTVTHQVSESKTNDFVQKFDAELEKMREEHRRALRAEEDKFSDELRNMRNSHEQRVSDLRIQQNSEINHMIDEFQQRKNSKQSEMQAFEAQKAGISEEHQRQIQDMRNRNRDEIEQLRASLQSQIQQIERENREKIDDARRKQDGELQNMKAKHEQNMAQLKSSNKKELDEIKKEHRSKVETMKAAHEEKLKEIRTKAAQQLDRERAKCPAPKAAPVEDTAKFDAHAEAELLKKKRNFEDELARLAAQHATILAEKKNELSTQLLELAKSNNKRIENARNECDHEIKKFKDRIEKEKKSIIKSIRLEAQRTEMQDREATTAQKLPESIPQYKPKLRRSNAKSINICDEFNGLCSMSRPQTIFQMRPTRSDSPMRKRKSKSVIDELDMTFTERKKVDLPPIEAPHSLPVETDLKNTMFVERTEAEHQSMKSSMDKVQRKFDASADRLSKQMTGTFTSITDDYRELQSFIQEQNRAMSKLSMEFRQKAMDLNQVFNHSLNDLEDVHRSALSTMSTLNRTIDIPMSPPQVVYQPQAPFTVDTRAAKYRGRHHKY